MRGRSNLSMNVSISPHIRSSRATKEVMWSVFLALIPAGAAGVFIFGVNALLVIIASIAAALIAEIAVQAASRKTISILDGSVFITGLLLAYNLPPGVPLWIPVIGSLFGVVVGKQLFGGLGHNIFNPALVGRAFLMASWPVYMTVWKAPRMSIDAVSRATPLGVLRHGDVDLASIVSLRDLLLGNRPGCIGEICIIALLAGAIFLLAKGHITAHTPFVYIATVAVLSWAFSGRGGLFKGEWLYLILNGGLILGAFFMATDYVTTPLSAKGKIVFGLGCGVITFLIRKFGGYPEGVSYSILMMNAATPIIDRYTRPKWFGYKGR